MPRDYIIYGETMVKVKGNGALSATLAGGTDFLATLWELGLATEGVRIIPRFIHQDIHVDDFGPNIPAEVMCMMADCRIEMTLIHYDALVLDACITESLGSSKFPSGTLAPAGQTLGRGLPLFSSGCHYISLSLAASRLVSPWRFPTSYLDSHPLIIPIGTERTIVNLSWRAIPYKPLMPNFGQSEEIMSSGAVLWDFFQDSAVEE